MAIKVIKRPSWFKPGPVPNLFYKQCPDTFSLPRHHSYNMWFGHAYDLTLEEGVKKGDQSFEYQLDPQFNHGQWLEVNHERLQNIAVFFNDVWVRESIVKNSGQTPGQFINSRGSTEAGRAEVMAAYMQAPTATDFFFAVDDQEEFWDLNMEGAKAMYEIYKKMLDTKIIAGAYWGAWNGFLRPILGKTKEQRSAHYTATRAQLLANVADYCMNPLWLGGLYGETGENAKRLGLGLNIINTFGYMMNFRDDFTFEHIETCECVKKAFPMLTMLTFQWLMHQPTVPGAEALCITPLGYFNQDGRTKSINQGVHAYPPDAAYNLTLWGILYGVFYHWNGSMTNGGQEQDYHQIQVDWSHYAKWCWGHDPIIRDILGTNTPVEMLEYSLDNGNTWNTGNALYPAYAQEAGRPIFRAKRNSAGTKAVFLGFWEAGLKGAEVKVKVRFPGTTTAYDFSAKRFTQMALVDLEGDSNSGWTYLTATKPAAPTSPSFSRLESDWHRPILTWSKAGAGVASIIHDVDVRTPGGVWQCLIRDADNWRIGGNVNEIVHKLQDNQPGSVREYRIRQVVNGVASLWSNVIRVSLGPSWKTNANDFQILPLAADQTPTVF